MNLRQYISRRFATVNEHQAIREGTVWCETHRTTEQAIERLLDFASQLSINEDNPKDDLRYQEEQFFQFLAMYILDTTTSSINSSIDMDDYCQLDKD